MTAFRTKPLPPIGDTAPPDTARHMPPLLIGFGILLGGAVIWLAIASLQPTRLMVRFDLIISDLFPKDPARCCDANGNEMRPLYRGARR